MRHSRRAVADVQRAGNKKSTKDGAGNALLRIGYDVFEPGGIGLSCPLKSVCAVCDVRLCGLAQGSISSLTIAQSLPLHLDGGLAKGPSDVSTSVRADPSSCDEKRAHTGKQQARVDAGGGPQWWRAETSNSSCPTPVTQTSRSGFPYVRRS